MSQTNRSRQKESTRKHLLETSLELFSKKGISGTTTLELAKIAKVAHGTVFVHFKTKEQLLFEVINEFGNKLSLRFNETVKQAQNTESILKAHLKVLAEFEDLYTSLIESLSSLPDQVKSRFYLLQSSISYHMYLCFEHEIAKGVVKNIERSKLFNTWIALLHYYLINKSVFCPQQSLISTYGDELITHFLHLIKK